jgi:deoxyadenosine/deoxycytidine kinase
MIHSPNLPQHAMRLVAHVTALMALLLAVRSAIRRPIQRRWATTNLGLAGSAFAKDLGPSGGRPVLVSIEGNIGAGKSTLLDALRAGETSRDWIFIDEPVGEWSTLKNEKGESMLEVFYKDRRRWSYTFQNCALLTRFQNIEAAIRTHSSVTGSGQRKVFVTERCLDTDYHVFTKMLRAEGSIDKLEYDLYERWFSQLKKTSTPLSAIVHVDTTPETCAQRIIKRGREGEGGIPLEYLRSLDKYQRDWVEAGTTPYIRADVTQCNKVVEFVAKICTA